ncbi:MAG: porin [Rhodothermaceae bacterium]
MKSMFTKISVLFVVLFTFAFSQDLSKIPAPKIGVWVVSNYQYVDSDNLTPDNNFNLKHARFLLKGKVMKNVSYHAMVDLHDNTEKGPKFMQAWVAYSLDKMLNIRVGQFKYPFGAEAYSSLMKWKFINPSFVTGGIVKKLGSSGSMFRDLGIQVYGQHQLSKAVGFEYKAMLMNGSGGNASDNNNDKDIVVYAGLKLPHKIHFGASVYSGKNGVDGEYSETAFGVQAKFNTKKLSLQAEYITANYEVSPTKEVEPDGFYAYATYKILPKFEAGARFDSYKSDSGATEKERFTLSAGYYLNPINRIMVNYEIKKDMDNLFTIQFYVGL